MNRILDSIYLLRDLVLASLFLIVPSLIDQYIREASGPETKFRVFEYGVLLALLLTIPLLCRRCGPIRINILNGSILLWIVYILLCSVFDIRMEYAFDYAFRTASWLLFALLLADACAKEIDFTRFVKIAVITQLIPVIYALGQAFGVDLYLKLFLGKEWIWQNENIGSDRGIIWSSLGNPNYYASYGGMLLIWLVALFCLSKRRWSKVLFVLYALILVYTLLRTLTRGVWVSVIPTALFAGIILVYDHHLQHRSLKELITSYWKLSLASAVLAVILLAGTYKLEPNQGPLHSLTKRFYHAVTLHDTSSRTRPLLWYASLRMWRERPILGQGCGRFAPLYLPTVYQAALETDPERIQNVTRSMNTIRFDRAHNDYVHFLAETGLIGYGLFIAVMLFGFAFALRNSVNPVQNRQSKILSYGCSAGITMTVIQCVYDFPLLLPASSMMFSLSLAGTLVLSEINRPDDSGIRFPGFSRWIVAVAIIPIFLGGSWIILRHLVSSHLHQKGIEETEAGLKVVLLDQNKAYQHYTESRNHLERANELYQGDGRILYELGRLDYAMYGNQYLPRAIKRLEEAQATFCTPEWYHLIVSFYIEGSRFDDARKQSETLLFIDPDRKESQYLAGMVDLKTGHFQDAMVHFKEELRVNPGNDRAYACLGEIYETHFDYIELAVLAYEQQLNLKPAIDVLIHVAELYAKLGQYDQAMNHYEKAKPWAQKYADKRFLRQVEEGIANVKRLQEKE